MEMKPSLPPRRGGQGGFAGLGLRQCRPAWRILLDAVNAVGPAAPAGLAGISAAFHVAVRGLAVLPVAVPAEAVGAELSGGVAEPFLAAEIHTHLRGHARLAQGKPGKIPLPGVFETAQVTSRARWRRRRGRPYRRRRPP